MWYLKFEKCTHSFLDILSDGMRFFTQILPGKVIFHCHHYLLLCTLPNVSSQINGTLGIVYIRDICELYKKYISTYGLSRLRSVL